MTKLAEDKREKRKEAFVTKAMVIIMKQISALLLAAIMLLSTACEQKTQQSAIGNIAVVRNLSSDDHTKQFLEGCVTEGESLGYNVDTFISNGDDAKFQELVSQAIQKGCDGLIISHGKADYSYDMLKPAVDQCIPIVAFDTVAEQDGNQLPGVTYTSQDDEALAKLSLDALVAKAQSEGRAARVIKVWYGPGLPPLDRRDVIYRSYEQQGLIETVESVGPSNLENVQGDVSAAVSAVLSKYQAGQVDGIWGSWDELAKGALTALTDANRTDVQLVSIDISNQDINLMRSNADVWTATAAVDPKMIGTVDMRILVMKLHGDATPDTYDFAAQLVETTQLSEGTNMEKLKDIIPGWGVNDDFKQPWMKSLRNSSLSFDVQNFQ